MINFYNRLNNISFFLRTIFFFVLIASFFNTIATSVGFTYPYNTFLFTAEDIFADFFKVIDALKISDTWSGENFYDQIGINFLPPFAMSIYTVVALMMKHLYVSKLTAYLLVFIVPLILLIKSSASFTNKSKYWFLILFSYPVLQILSRGNLAGLVFVFLAFFLLNVKNIYASMFFLALAVSIKITPVIFVAYFVVSHITDVKKIIKGAGFFLIFLFVINLLSVMLLNHTVSKTVYNPYAFFSSLAVYEKIMVYGFGGLIYGSSFYMAFRLFIHIVARATHFDLFYIILAVPALVINSLAILLLLIVYLKKFSLDSFKNMLLDRYTILKLVCIVYVLFTPVTGDYYLAVLLLPIFFIPFHYFKPAEKLIYLLVLSPKNYFFVRGISLQVLINPLLLIAMLLVVTGVYNFDFKPRRERVLT